MYFLRRLRIYGTSKREVLSKLIAYSTIYGLLMINYIDLVTPGSNIPGYHLWLIIQYFAPFLSILCLLGFEDWELIVSLGLLGSLMNDLFYAPIGMILFGKEYDLIEWYLWQLGFHLFDVKWYANLLFIMIPVSSSLMGASIYARIITTILLCYKWWREE